MSAYFWDIHRIILFATLKNFRKISKLKYWFNHSAHSETHHTVKPKAKQRLLKELKSSACGTLERHRVLELC